MDEFGVGFLDGEWVMRVSLGCGGEIGYKDGNGRNVMGFT